MFSKPGEFCWKTQWDGPQGRGYKSLSEKNEAAATLRSPPLISLGFLVRAYCERASCISFIAFIMS